ncbi:MAG: type II secretion system protein GspG [candidate division Zixibacteria bacterium]|nr:type II secretion system protein GspG [candidate division Zixibacteria bacterium]
MVTHIKLNHRARSKSLRDCELGFTLGEIVIVIVIIGILATVALRTMSGAVDNSRHQEALEELELLSEAIIGNPELVSGGVRTDFGYVGDVGALPTSLDNLVTNPGGYATWNGPYIRYDFNEDANDFKTDPWGVEYTYSGSVSIQSTGSGSSITKNFSNSSANLLATSVRGTILDRNGTPPGSYADNISVQLSYPNGSGALTTLSVNPNSSGAFSFSEIPVGNHNISAIYQIVNDTLTNFVTVFPRTGGFTGILRFGTDHWIDSLGGGSGSSGIQYVPGTASILPSGSHKDLYFDIYNSGTTAISLNWIVVTHAIGGIFALHLNVSVTTIFSDNCDKLAPGDTAVASPAYALNPNDTVTVNYGSIKSIEGCGGATTGIPDNTDFSVDFSDGSSISFTGVW